MYMNYKNKLVLMYCIYINIIQYIQLTIIYEYIIIYES